MAALAVVLLTVGCAGSRSGDISSDADASRVCAIGGSQDAIQQEIDGLLVLAATDSTETYWAVHLAEHRMADGRAADAEKWLARILAQDSDHAPALSLLSKLYYAQNRHEEGIQLLEAARDRQGGSFAPELEAGLALHYAASAREERLAAIDHLAQQGTEPETLAYLLLTSDNYLHALDSAQRGVELKPHSAAAHNNLGIALLYAGRAEAAREAFRRALELDADLAGAMYNLAIVEHVHFFDEAAGRTWLARYFEHSDYDPDGLRELFAADQEVAR